MKRFCNRNDFEPKDHRGQDSSLGSLRRTLWAGGVLVALGLVSAGAVAAGVDFCSETAQDVGRACRTGASSDFSLALGKCANLSDPAIRSQCQQQAAADQNDAVKTCKDQQRERRAECKRLGEAPYDPVIDPANFSTSTLIDNPLFPLKPGTTFIYEGPTADGLEHREERVTRKTKVILGVTCVEIHDLIKINGKITEDTIDWYAQDNDGNVWYFGENSKQVADGLIVGLEGTWTGGIDGAKPGIIMEAHNAVGDFYRQEFSLDTAEDLAEVQSLSESVTVPFGSFNNNNCLKTLETTPLNLSDVSNKIYCPGVGEVLIQDLPPGTEKLELVKITP